MALAYIGSTADARVTGSASSTSAVTIANSGALMVVNALIYNTGGTTCTVSDDVNGSYTETGHAFADSGSECWQFYFANATSGSVTVTVNPGGASADIEFWTSEVTGAATSSVLDTESGSTTAATTNAAGTMTITSAGTLDQADNIVFVVATHNTVTRTLTTGTIGGSAATQVGENEDNASGQCGHVEYRIINSTSALTSTVTWGTVGADGVGTYGIVQGIYKQAAGGGGSAVPKIMQQAI